MDVSARILLRSRSADFLVRVLAILTSSLRPNGGKFPEKISTVAVCGGSGSDLAPIAFHRGADVYLSAEIKHSTAIWAVENNFCIIDGTHYATEKPAVTLLVKKLKEADDRNGLEHQHSANERGASPLRFNGYNTPTIEKNIP